MRSKFKKQETAKSRRDEALSDIFAQAEFLMRLSDNHPDVMPPDPIHYIRGIAQSVLAVKLAVNAEEENE